MENRIDEKDIMSLLIKAIEPDNDYCKSIKKQQSLHRIFWRKVDGKKMCVFEWSYLRRTNADTWLYYVGNNQTGLKCDKCLEENVYNPYFSANLQLGTYYCICSHCLSKC